MTARIPTRTLLLGGVCTLLISAAYAAAPVGPDFSSGDRGYSANGVAFHAVPGERYVPITPPYGYPTCGNRELKRCNWVQNPDIGDPTNPILTPWAADLIKKTNATILGGGQSFQAMSRCWPGGVPGMMQFTAEPTYYLTAPKEVTMLYSRGPNIRHIYMNVPHTANPAPTWLGESTGRYDGKAFMIDTIGLNDKTFIDWYHTPHSTKLHVTERYEPVAEATVVGARDSLTTVGPTLKGTFTVEDPIAFTTKWSGWIDYLPRVLPIAESENICAENNDANYYGEDEIPIPQTKTPDF